jgi:hypothetical protein
VQVVAQDEPTSVVACHCVDCQRRTGSVFGVGAYYADEHIAITGATRSSCAPPMRRQPVLHVLLPNVRDVGVLALQYAIRA